MRKNSSTHNIDNNSLCGLGSILLFVLLVRAYYLIFVLTPTSKQLGWWQQNGDHAYLAHSVSPSLEATQEARLNDTTMHNGTHLFHMWGKTPHRTEFTENTHRHSSSEPRVGTQNCVGFQMPSFRTRGNTTSSLKVMKQKQNTHSEAVTSCWQLRGCGATAASPSSNEPQAPLRRK